MLRCCLLLSLLLLIAVLVVLEVVEVVHVALVELGGSVGLHTAQSDTMLAASRATRLTVTKAPAACADAYITHNRCCLPASYMGHSAQSAACSTTILAGTDVQALQAAAAVPVPLPRPCSGHMSGSQCWSTCAHDLLRLHTASRTPTMHSMTHQLSKLGSTAVLQLDALRPTVADTEQHVMLQHINTASSVTELHNAAWQV